MKQKQFKNEFEADVFHGLNSNPKFLNSKYFYDKNGDLLFQKIMALPEYYPTQAEFDILERHKQKLSELFSAQEEFDLIELGAGDAKKTKILLRYFQQQHLDFIYHPADISENVLQELVDSLQTELPKLQVQPFVGTHSRVLKQLEKHIQRKKILLFLGSNIGNFDWNQAIIFLKEMATSMQPNDLLLVGFDQKKHPQHILNAYNDSAGVTEAFNKNLLLRINRELGANFDSNSFLHWPVYDPESGMMKSYLLSKIEQEILIPALDMKVKFKKWESIHTENSQKFDDAMLDKIATAAGLKVLQSFWDEDHLFRDCIFKKIQN